MSYFKRWNVSLKYCNLISVHPLQHLQISMNLSEFALNLIHQEHAGSPMVPLARFNAKSLEIDLAQQTYITSITVKLGSIDLQQYRDNDTINIISSPLFTEKNQYLINVNFMQVCSHKYFR